MASPSRNAMPSATPPTETIEGPGGALLMIMTGLAMEPASGRLLRGFTPYLDEQGATEVFLLTERSRAEPWMGEEAWASYQELVHWERREGEGNYRGVCTRGEGLAKEELVHRFTANPDGLIDWAAEKLQAAVISTTEPLKLDTHYVEKPWGREGWFTGIEKRGVSCVRSSTGRTELPYALGMFPVPLLGPHEPELILLKTLEPRPEPVLGDLYLEVHREKWETYLVLEVNRKAWPDGTGCLRAGVDADMLKKYRKSHGARAPQALGKALGQKIAAYEKVRREIDERVDAGLREKGLADNEPAPELRQKLAARLPARLRNQEAKLRAEVEAFLGHHPLREGDVACLPPGVLHSLQHGVTVVEFQTPTYERLIAMFAQKVVTQPHWDTEQALTQTALEPYTPPATTPLECDQPGVTVDRIVDFPQFQVERARLEPGAARAEGAPQPPAYRLLVVTEGTARLKLPGGPQRIIGKGQACLIPAALADLTVAAGRKEGLTYLTAHPVGDARP